MVSIWFSIIGIVALILSFLYFFKPATIKKLDEFGKKVILNPERFIKQGKKIAVFYLIAGIGLIYIAFFFK
jgi:hypothetical protein